MKKMTPEEAQKIQDKIFKKMAATQKIKLVGSFFRFGKKLQSLNDRKKVNFVSPEDLILSKLLWFQDSQSTRQLEDIKSVLAITNVDLKYVKNWAEKHGTIEILNDLLK